MTESDLSRRAFFRQAAIAPAAAIAGSVPEPPQRAWLIVEVGWEHNDEFTFQEGEFPRKKLYYKREEAEAECRRLCEEFFQAQTPEEFEVDFVGFLWERMAKPGFDHRMVTWDELRKAGFPDPFHVLEVQP